MKVEGRVSRFRQRELEGELIEIVYRISKTSHHRGSLNFSGFLQLYGAGE